MNYSIVIPVDSTFQQVPTNYLRNCPQCNGQAHGSLLRRCPRDLWSLIFGLGSEEERGFLARSRPSRQLQWRCSLSHITSIHPAKMICLLCSINLHTWSCLGPLLTVTQAVMVLWHTERHNVRRITTHIRPRTSLKRSELTCILCCSGSTTLFFLSVWRGSGRFAVHSESRHLM